MSAGIDEPGGQVLQAGQDIETVPGWTSLIAGEPWTASELWLSAASIDIRRVAPRWSGAAEPSAGLELSGPPELTSIGLADVVGVDHIGDDPDGLAILEFALAAGNVVHARLPESFVDEVVAALQRSRAGVPPTFEPAPAPAPAPEPEPEPEPMVEIEDPPPPPKGKSGSKSALAAEVRELRDYLDRLGFPERRALRADIDSLVAHRTEVLAEVRAATLARREQEVALVRVRREAVLQDVGIYRPRHPAEDSVALRSRLETTQAAIEELVKAGDAVSATDDWTVNGSKAEGLKIVGELAQLLLRTYNAEADLLVATLRPYELDAAVDRLAVTLATVHRLGASMEIEISDELHRLRVEELSLAADELALRDEARRRALDADRLPDGAAGNLYVVSNRGAFGPDVVRIGVTELDQPAEVVDHVDAGRLPFRSDLHALVPSPDAAELLAGVRSALDDHRVNLTDPQCPFFSVSPDVVRDVLVDLAVTVPWFVATGTAEEWHQSRNARDEND